jgi:trimethylamine--corrinoid protein Co-methyltransferase
MGRPEPAAPTGEPLHALLPSDPVRVLGPSELERIHVSTLRVLERVGVEVRSAHLLDRLAAAGADVDLAALRVRFPPALVEEALRRPPRTLVLAGRDPAHDLRLDGRHGYLALDGCAAELVDLETGARRASTLADLALITLVADALPQIGLLWQAVAARDLPVETQPLHELHAQLSSSTKHVQLMTAVRPEQARSAVEIARIVAGGERALRDRPILSAFQCSLSPLAYEGRALESAAVYASAGVPCGFVAMPIACATAPATPAAALIVSNAEVLAGIVALELLHPGAPTFYGACGTVMDLRSGAAACGGPEDLFVQLASAQLARTYGLPSSIGTFATGAKSPDWQAGMEGGLSVMSSWLGGADLLCGAGLLHGARVHSSLEMLLDAELFDLVCVLSEGMRTDEEDLALETIREVGPGGHFLAHAHTRRHMRRRWRSGLFGREAWEEWEARGRPDAANRARERLRHILAEHRPTPLPEADQQRIREVIAAHGR